ncbi:WXG100-like domain-containing protein [Micromonospora sp. NPDC004704]
MAIEASDQLAGFLKWVSGEDFPGANEDRLFGMSRAYYGAADGVEAAIPLLVTAVESIREGVSGQADEAFVESMRAYVDEEPGFLAAAGLHMRKLGAKSQTSGTQVQYVKMTLIGAIILLLIEFAVALAFSFFNPGAALNWLAARVAIFRFLVRTLLGRLLMHVVMNQIIGIGLQVLLDLIVQRLQMAMGTRDHIDTSLTRQAAIAGAVGGAIATVLGPAANRIFRRFGGEVADAVVDNIPTPKPPPKSFLDALMTPAPKPTARQAVVEAAEELVVEAGTEVLAEGTVNAINGEGFKVTGAAATSGILSAGASIAGTNVGNAIRPGPDDGPNADGTDQPTKSTPTDVPTPVVTPGGPPPGSPGGVPPGGPKGGSNDPGTSTDGGPDGPTDSDPATSTPIPVGAVPGAGSTNGPASTPSSAAPTTGSGTPSSGPDALDAPTPNAPTPDGSLPDGSVPNGSLSNAPTLSSPLSNAPTLDGPLSNGPASDLPFASAEGFGPTVGGGDSQGPVTTGSFTSSASTPPAMSSGSPVSGAPTPTSVGTGASSTAATNGVGGSTGPTPVTSSAVSSSTTAAGMNGTPAVNPTGTTPSTPTNTNTPTTSTSPTQTSTTATSTAATPSGTASSTTPTGSAARTGPAPISSSALSSSTTVPGAVGSSTASVDSAAPRPATTKSTSTGPTPTGPTPTGPTPTGPTPTGSSATGPTSAGPIRVSSAAVNQNPDPNPTSVSNPADRIADPRSEESSTPVETPPSVTDQPTLTPPAPPTTPSTPGVGGADGRRGPVRHRPGNSRERRAWNRLHRRFRPGTVLPTVLRGPVPVTLAGKARSAGPAPVGDLTRGADGTWYADGVPLIVRPVPGGRAGVGLLSDADFELVRGRPLPDGDGAAVLVHGAGDLVRAAVRQADGTTGAVLLDPDQVARIVAEVTPPDAPLVLVACQPGALAGGFAQRLASARGTDVLAASGDVIAGSDDSPGNLVTVGGDPWLLFVPEGLGGEGWDVLNDDVDGLARPFDGITAIDGDGRGPGLRLGRGPSTNQEASTSGTAAKAKPPPWTRFKASTSAEKTPGTPPKTTGPATEATPAAPLPDISAELGVYHRRPELLSEVDGAADVDRLVNDLRRAVQGQVRARVSNHLARITYGGRQAISVDTTAIEEALRTDLQSFFTTGGRTFDVRDGWRRWHSVTIAPTRFTDTQQWVDQSADKAKYDTRNDANVALKDTATAGDSLALGLGASIGGRFGPGGALSGDLAFARAAETAESSGTLSDSRNVRSGAGSHLVLASVQFTVTVDRAGRPPATSPPLHETGADHRRRMATHPPPPGGPVATVAFRALDDIARATHTARPVSSRQGRFDVSTLVESLYPVRIEDARLDRRDPHGNRVDTPTRTWNVTAEDILQQLRPTGTVGEGSIGREQVRALLSESSVLGQVPLALESSVHSPLVLSSSRRQAVALELSSEVTEMEVLEDVAKSSFRWQPGVTSVGRQQHVSSVGGGGSGAFRWGFGFAYIQARLSAGFRRNTTTSVKQSSTARTGTEFKDVKNVLARVKVRLTIDASTRVNAFQQPFRRSPHPVVVELTILARLPRDKAEQLLAGPPPADDSATPGGDRKGKARKPPEETAGRAVLDDVPEALSEAEGSDEVTNSDSEAETVPDPLPPPWAKTGGNSVPYGMSRFRELHGRTSTLVRGLGGGFLPRFRTGGAVKAMGFVSSASERQKNQSELDRVLSVPALRQNYTALLNGGVAAVLTRTKFWHSRHVVVHVTARHTQDLTYSGVEKGVAVRNFQSNSEQDGAAAGAQWRAALAVEGGFIGRFPGPKASAAVMPGGAVEGQRRWAQQGGVETTGQETALHGGTPDSQRFDGELELVVTVYTYKKRIGRNPRARLGIGHRAGPLTPTTAPAEEWDLDRTQVGDRQLNQYRLTTTKPVSVLFAKSAIPRQDLGDLQVNRVDAVDGDRLPLRRRAKADLSTLRDFVDRPAPAPPPQPQAQAQAQPQPPQPPPLAVSDWRFVEAMPGSRELMELAQETVLETQQYEEGVSRRQLGGLRGDVTLVEGMPVWAEMVDRFSTNQQVANLGPMTEQQWDLEPITTEADGGRLNVSVAARLVRPRLAPNLSEVTTENAPGGGVQVWGTRTRENQIQGRVQFGVSGRETSKPEDKFGGGGTASGGYQRILYSKMTRHRKKVSGFIERNVNNRKARTRSYLVVADLRASVVAEVTNPADMPKSLLPEPFQPASWEHHKTVTRSAVIENAVYLWVSEDEAIRLGLITRPGHPAVPETIAEEVADQDFVLPAGRSPGLGLQTFHQVPSLVRPAIDALRAMVARPNPHPVFNRILATLTGMGLADPMLNRRRLLNVLSRTGFPRHWAALFDGGVSLLYPETGKVSQRLFDIRLVAVADQPPELVRFVADHNDIDVRTVGVGGQGRTVRSGRGDALFTNVAGSAILNPDGKPVALGAGHQYGYGSLVLSSNTSESENRTTDISSGRGVKARTRLRPRFEIRIYYRGRPVRGGVVSFQAPVTVDRWATNLRVRPTGTAARPPAEPGDPGAYQLPSDQLPAPHLRTGRLRAPGWRERNGILVPPRFAPEDLDGAQVLQDAVNGLLQGVSNRLAEAGFAGAHQVHQGLTPELLLPNASDLLADLGLELPEVPSTDLSMKGAVVRVRLVPVAVRLAGVDAGVYREHVQQATGSSGSGSNALTQSTQAPRILLGRGYLGDPYQALETGGAGPSTGETAAVASGEEGGSTGFGNVKPEGPSAAVAYVCQPVVEVILPERVRVLLPARQRIGRPVDPVTVVLRMGLDDARQVLAIDDSDAVRPGMRAAFDQIVANDGLLHAAGERFVAATDAEEAARYRLQSVQEPRLRDRRMEREEVVDARAEATTEWQAAVEKRERAEAVWWDLLRTHSQLLDDFEATYVGVPHRIADPVVETDGDSDSDGGDDPPPATRNTPAILPAVPEDDGAAADTVGTEVRRPPSKLSPFQRRRTERLTDAVVRPNAGPLPVDTGRLARLRQEAEAALRQDAAAKAVEPNVAEPKVEPKAEPKVEPKVVGTGVAAAKVEPKAVETRVAKPGKVRPKAGVERVRTLWRPDRKPGPSTVTPLAAAVPTPLGPVSASGTTVTSPAVTSPTSVTSTTMSDQGSAIVSPTDLAPAAPVRVTELVRDKAGTWYADGKPLVVRRPPGERAGVALLSDADWELVRNRSLPYGSGGALLVHGAGGFVAAPVRLGDGTTGEVLLTPEQVSRIVTPLVPPEVLLVLVACRSDELSGEFTQGLASARDGDVLAASGDVVVGSDFHPGKVLSIGGSSWSLFTPTVLGEQGWDTLNDFDGQPIPFDGIVAEDGDSRGTGLRLGRKSKPSTSATVPSASTSAPAGTPATAAQLGRYHSNPDLLYEVDGASDLDRLVTDVTEAVRQRVRARVRPGYARATWGGRQGISVDTTAIEAALRQDLQSFFTTGGRTFDVRDGWRNWHSVTITPTRNTTGQRWVDQSADKAKFDTRNDFTSVQRDTATSADSLAVGGGFTMASRFGPGGGFSAEAALAQAAESSENTSSLFDSHNVRSGGGSNLVLSSVEFTVTAGRVGTVPQTAPPFHRATPAVPVPAVYPPAPPVVTAQIGFRALDDIANAGAPVGVSRASGDFDVPTLVENLTPVRVLDAAVRQPDGQWSVRRTWNQVAEQVLQRIRRTGTVDPGSTSRDQLRSLLTEPSLLGQLPLALESPANSPLLLSPSRRQAVSVQMQSRVTDFEVLADVKKSSFRWQPGVTDNGRQQHVSMVGSGGSVVPIRWGFGLAYIQLRLSAAFRRNTTTTVRQSTTTRTGTEFKDIENVLARVTFRVTIDPSTRVNTFQHWFRRRTGVRPVELELTVLARLPKDKAALLISTVQPAGTAATSGGVPARPTGTAATGNRNGKARAVRQDADPDPDQLRRPPPYALFGGHAMPYGMSRFAAAQRRTTALIGQIGGGFLPRYQGDGVVRRMGFSTSASERQNNQTELDGVLSMPALRQNYTAMLNGGVTATLTRTKQTYSRHIVVHVAARHPRQPTYAGEEPNVAVRNFQASSEQDGSAAGAQWRAAVAVEGGFIGRLPGPKVNTSLSPGGALEFQQRWGRQSGIEVTGQETSLHGGTPDSERFEGDLELVVTVYSYTVGLGRDRRALLGLGRRARRIEHNLVPGFTRLAQTVQVGDEQIPQYRLTDTHPVKVLHSRSALPSRDVDYPVSVAERESRPLARQTRTDISTLRQFVDQQAGTTPAPAQATSAPPRREPAWDWRFVEAMPGSAEVFNLAEQAVLDTQRYAPDLASKRKVGGLRGDAALARGMPVWADLVNRLSNSRQMANLGTMTERQWDLEPLTTDTDDGRLDVSIVARMTRPRLVPVGGEISTENAPGGGVQVWGSRTRERQWLGRIQFALGLRKPGKVEDKAGGGGTGTAGYQHVFRYRMRRWREKVSGFIERNINNRKGQARTFLVVADLRVSAVAEVTHSADFPAALVPSAIQPDRWQNHKTAERSAVIKNAVYLRVTEEQAAAMGLLDGPEGPLKPPPPGPSSIRQDADPALALPAARSAGLGLQTFHQVPSLVRPAIDELEKAVAAPNPEPLAAPILAALNGTALADPMLNRRRMLNLLSPKGVRRNWAALFDGGVSLIHADTGAFSQHLYDVRLHATLNDPIEFDRFVANHDDIDVRMVGARGAGKLMRRARGWAVYFSALASGVMNPGAKPPDPKAPEDPNAGGAGALGGGYQYNTGNLTASTNFNESERRTVDISSGRGVKARIRLNPHFEIRIYHQGRAVPANTITFREQVTVDRWAGDLRSAARNRPPAALDGPGAYPPQARPGVEPGWQDRDGLLLPPRFTPEDLSGAAEVQQAAAELMADAARRLRTAGYPGAQQVQQALTPEILLPNARALLSTEGLVLPALSSAEASMQKAQITVRLEPVAARLAGVDSGVYREHVEQSGDGMGSGSNVQHQSMHAPRIVGGRGYINDPYQPMETGGAGPSSGETVANAAGEENSATGFGNVKPEGPSAAVAYVCRPVVEVTLPGKWSRPLRIRHRSNEDTADPVVTVVLRMGRDDARRVLGIDNGAPVRVHDDFDEIVANEQQLKTEADEFVEAGEAEAAARFAVLESRLHDGQPDDDLDQAWVAAVRRREVAEATWWETAQRHYRLLDAFQAGSVAVPSAPAPTAPPLPSKPDSSTPTISKPAFVVPPLFPFSDEHAGPLGTLSLPPIQEDDLEPPAPKFPDPEPFEAEPETSAPAPPVVFSGPSTLPLHAVLPFPAVLPLPLLGAEFVPVVGEPVVAPEVGPTPALADTDLDHEYGVVVDPKRVKPSELADGVVRLNPMWYRLEDFKPALLERLGARWHYVVDVDGGIRVGSEEILTVVEDGEWERLVEGMRSVGSELTVDEVKGLLDGQGHPTIAAGFVGGGGAEVARARISGEFGWNAVLSRWEVNDKSGRYMSDKVRPDLDPVEIARWLDNVARRLSERFGVEVHPVLLKHAEPAAPPAPEPVPAIVPEDPVPVPQVPETAPPTQLPVTGGTAVGVARLTDAIIRPYAGPLPGRPALMAELRDRVTAALNSGLGEEYAAQLAVRIAAAHGVTHQPTELHGDQ